MKKSKTLLDHLRAMSFDSNSWSQFSTINLFWNVIFKDSKGTTSSLLQWIWNILFSNQQYEDEKSLSQTDSKWLLQI